jgi:DNA-binding NtrC family response regulator
MVGDFPVPSRRRRSTEPDDAGETPLPLPEPDKETLEDSLRGQRVATTFRNACLFVVLEGDRPLAGGARFAVDDVDEIVVGRGSERAATVEESAGARRLMLRLPSGSMSRVHTRLRRAPEGWHVEDARSRNGCYLNGRRIAKALMGPGDILEVGHVFLMVRAFSSSQDGPLPDLDGAELDQEPTAFRTLVPTIAARLGDLRRACRSTIAILLSGETGTGKEVLARAIHAQSGRTGPFVAVNCSTLTDGLAESQLFGHVKGAFSGAIADSVGFVRAADRGTLLLDEVGDLGDTAQGALLRVLQEQEVVPVGRAAPHKVDVRFVATTPRALEHAIRREQFRSDLFARLSGFVHVMAPLRERRADLGLMVAALLRKAGVGEADRPRVVPEMGLDLLRHEWPLNIRELEQVLARSWLLTDDGVMKSAFIAAQEPAPAPVARTMAAEDQEMRRRLTEALARAKGNVSEAARALGRGRVRIHRLMKRLEIDPKLFRD